MTVSIVQDTGQAPANSGTVSFTLGSTPAVGDVLVAFCSWNAFDRTISTPSGWALTETVINANSQAISTFWHVVQSGDGTSWSFTVNTAGGNDYTSGVLYEVTGASTAAPVNVYAGATYGTATGTFATASVAPTVLGCLPLAGWTTDGGQTFSSVSSGWAEDLSEDTSYHTTFAAHQTANTTDTSTPVSCTLTITGTDVGASQILLIGPVAPPAPYITQSTDVAAGPTASIAFTLPVAPTPGDLLVAFTAYNYGGGERSITPPSGSWVQVDDTGAGEGSGDALATFYYVAQSGDPATWTFTIATTGGNDWGSGVLYEVIGQSTSAPVNKHSPAAYGGGTSAFTTASVTPSVLGTLPLAALTTDGSETLSSVSSGWLTDQVAAGGYHSSFSAHQRLLTADTVTAVSNTFTIGGADAGSSEILLIAPQPAPPAAAVTTAAGQAVRARLPRVLPRGRIASSPGSRPPILLLNTAEGGTSGVTATSANTGGASGSAFNAVTVGAGATLAFDSTHYAHGSLSYKIATGASGVACDLDWSQSALGTQTQIWFRFYLYFTAIPVNTHRIFEITQVPSGTACGGLLVNTAGNLYMVNGAGSPVITSTQKIPLNQWFRVEGYVLGSPSAGQVSFSVFSPDDSSVPAWTYTSALTNTTGPFGDIKIGPGVYNIANVGPFWIDSIGISNTGYLGSASLTGPASLGRPVSAATRPLPRRGRTGSSGGAPVRNPSRGPVFAQAVHPAQARIPQVFSKGRTASACGGPVLNPPHPAPLYPLQRPVQARRPLPPHGRIALGNKGGPLRNPLRGPVFRQAVRPIRAVIPQNAPRGRASANPGGPVVNPVLGTLKFRTGSPYFQWATEPPWTQWEFSTGNPIAQWATEPPWIRWDSGDPYLQWLTGIPEAG